MPDVSNEDLMKLIQRILQRVDTIEGKLDRLLARNHSKNKPNSKFIYFPIKTDEDLLEISNKITKDEQYKENLRDYIERQGNFKLHHLFADEFLMNCNSTGSYDQHKLEELVPFDKIYAYLRVKRGELPEDIRRDAALEVARTKQRLRMIQYRRGLKRAKHKGTNLDEGLDSEMIVEALEDDYIIEEQVEAPEEFIVETVDESTVEQEVEESEQGTKEQSTDGDDYDDGFEPISNERELKRISLKINTNPVYLKNLRLQIVEESINGICTLQQLFTPEYLRKSVTMIGTPTTNRLSDLVPYQTVYHYLRKHLGHSSKKIEQEVSIELKKIKERLYFREKRKKAKTAVC